MSANSPVPASDHSMVTFLRQRYSFQEGDTWEFEVKGTTHAGTLRINGPTVYFAHTQDSQVATSPNALYKALARVSSNMGGPQYSKLLVQFHRSGKEKAWKQLTDEWKSGDWSSPTPAPKIAKKEPRVLFPEAEPGADSSSGPEVAPGKDKKARRRRWKPEEEKAVFHSTAGTCYLCRGQLVFENRKRGLPGAWHIEHVIPFATNPEMDVCANLLPAHAECNVTKGARTITEAVERFDQLTVDTRVLTMEKIHPYVREKLVEAKKRCWERKGLLVVTMSLDENESINCEPFVEDEDDSEEQEGEEDSKEESDEEEKEEEEDVVRARKLSGVTLGKKLSWGGHAVVHQGSWKGQTVALKKALAGKEQYLIKEINILWGLRHDNLVEIYGYWIDESADLWMVMEYLPAGDLRVALPKVSPIRVMQDIASAMVYLHSMRIIHRDLKPGNILITKDKRAKIADFGTARFLVKHAENLTIVYSGGSHAPELRSQKYDLSLDVHCYGRLFQQIHGMKYPEGSRFERELIELAKRCTVENPKQRPTFEKILTELTRLARER